MKVKRAVAISTDCTADIPDDILEKLGVEVIYFYISTESGRFRDTDEITSRNIIDYTAGGIKKATSAPPSPEEYREFFTQQLTKCEKLIHICIGGKVSLAYENACAAVQDGFENTVTVIDSLQLSTGMAHMVMKACELRDKKKQAHEIANELEKMKHHVSSTFSAESAEYLYYNGRVNEGIAKICRILNLHPILGMKDGSLKLIGIGAGNYNNALKRYIRKRLKNKETIDTDRVFITCVGCSVKTKNMVKKEVEKHLHFREIIVNEASATVSVNSGPGTVGVLYTRKYN